MTGTWRLDRAESDFGFLPPPRLRVDDITLTPTSLVLITRQKDADGDRIYERRLTLGAAAIAVDILGRPRHILDRFELAPDSASIAIQRLHELPGGPVRQRLILRRAAA